MCSQLDLAFLPSGNTRDLLSRGQMRRTNSWLILFPNAAILLLVLAIQPSHATTAEAQIVTSRQYLRLEVFERPGVHVMVEVGRPDRALDKLSPAKLRARFENYKRLIESRGGKSLDAEQVKTWKRELVNTYGALDHRKLATTEDTDQLLSIALSPPSIASSVRVEFSRESAKRAEGLLRSLTSEHAPETIESRKGTKDHLVTNLVIGTLTVFYDSALTPGKPGQLSLQFEPRSILSDEITGTYFSGDAVEWHVKPQYGSQVLASHYDYDQSGKKPEERTLNLHGNQKETWVWTVWGPKDFKKDDNDLIFYMGYQTGTGAKEADVWRHKITWTEVNVPGTLEKSWAWIKDNTSWVFGIFAAFTTIWAGVKTIQLRRLELKPRTKTSEE